jgi:hypothetical protein
MVAVPCRLRRSRARRVSCGPSLAPTGPSRASSENAGSGPSTLTGLRGVRVCWCCWCCRCGRRPLEAATVNVDVDVEDRRSTAIAGQPYEPVDRSGRLDCYGGVLQTQCDAGHTLPGRTPARVLGTAHYLLARSAYCRHRFSLVCSIDYLWSRRVSGLLGYVCEF